MPSTIQIPDAASIGASGPVVSTAVLQQTKQYEGRIADALISVATAASTDIGALQLGGTTEEITLMPLGDSITAGDATSDGTGTGWREFAYTLLRARGMRVRFVGTRRGIRAGGTVLGYETHEGVGGNTISQIATNGVNAINSLGAPRIIVILWGTNDVNNGSSAATVLAAMDAGLTALKAVAPITSTSYIIGGLPPFADPAASAAAKQLVVDEINSQLEAWCAARSVTFAPAGALLGAGHMDASSGFHPIAEGQGLLGRSFGETTLKALVGVYRPAQPVPRVVTGLTPRAWLSFGLAADGLQFPYAAGHTPQGAGSWTIAIKFRPRNLTGLRRIIQTYGPALADGVGVFTNGTFLAIYAQAGAPQIQSNVLRIGKWHLIVVSYDGAADILRVYVAREGEGRAAVGSLAGFATGVALNLTLQGTTLVGTNISGIPSALGHIGDYFIANSYAATAEDVYTWYYENAPPEQLTGGWPITNGSGTTVTARPGLGSPNSSSFAATWEPAGAIRDPWAPDYDRDVEWNIGGVQTAAYTAAWGELVLCNPATPFTVTAPTAVGNKGKRFAVKNATSSTNAITIDGNASETVDRVASQDITAADDKRVYTSDGANIISI